MKIILILCVSLSIFALTHLKVSPELANFVLTLTVADWLILMIQHWLLKKALAFRSWSLVTCWVATMLHNMYYDDYEGFKQAMEDVPVPQVWPSVVYPLMIMRMGAKFYIVWKTLNQFFRLWWPDEDF